MVVTPSAIVTLVSGPQNSKASMPMFVTLPGMVMLVRPLQNSQALFPMLVTLVGVVMSVMLLHWEKAKSPMLVTGKPFVHLGITTGPPGPVYPVMVIAPLLVVNVNCACSKAGRVN